ncbi:MAG: ribbon-helix-helix protein, CopG family [Terricaulis sp.]|nr:ribbon-helix-helix protein, CopG family [Terricaulis sp.]
MSIEKISVSIPADLMGDVRAAIADGDYATASEVLRDALRDWKLKRKIAALEVNELRRLWDEADDGEPLRDGEAVFARLLAKARARQDSGGA